MLHDSASGSLGQSFGDALGAALNDAACPPSPGETASAFLRWFDPTGRHNVVRLDPNEKHGPLGMSFEPGEFEKIAAYVDEWDGKSNLYFSVHEPREHAPDQRLAGYHIAKLRAIVGDVDLPGANGATELVELRSTIEAKLRDVGAPAPSYLLDSGGGLQLGWILPEKLDVRREDIELVEDAGRGAAALIAGDAVSDRARIMRLPGPQNLPTAKKRAKGRVVRRATLLSQGERCTVEKLTAAIPPIAGPSVAADADATIAAFQAEFETSPAFNIYFEKDWPEELAGRFTEALIADPALAALWAGERPKKGDGTGSSYRAALAGRIGRLGWSAEDYVMLVRAWPFALQGGDFSEKLNERALARDWVRIALPVHPQTIAEARAALVARLYEPLVAPAAGASSSASNPAAVMCGAAGVGAEIVDIFGHADPGELGTPPAGSLPPVLQAWIRSEARRKGVSEAFAALCAIAVAAAAVGASVRLQVKQRDTGFTEPASLWAAVIAPPGSAKSAIVSAAVTPLRKLEKLHRQEWAPRHAEWERQVEAYKRRGKRTDVPEPSPEPRCSRALVDNFTMERAVRLFEENPRGLLCTPDELAALLGSFGAYKASGDGDRAQILRTFDGGEIQTDRVSGTRYAESALLGVLASSQPDKMREIADKLGGDGLLQRFLFVMPDGREREAVDEEPDAGAAAAYETAILILARTTHGREARVRVAPDAAAIREAGLRRIRDLKHLFGVSPAFVGHTEKFEKFLARITLTFHCLDEIERSGDVDPERMVSAETMRRAVAFASFLMRHSLEFYRQFVGLSDTATEAQWVAGHLLAHPERGIVSLRNLYDAYAPFKGTRGHKRCIAVMCELETAGWVTAKEVLNKADKNKWIVSSAIHVRFAEHARREAARRREAQERIRVAGEARRAINGQDEEAYPPVVLT